MKKSVFALIFALIATLAFACLFGCASAGKQATTVKMAKKEMKAAIEELPDRYRQFLEDVEPIISNEERVIFLKIKLDFERDEFIERF